MNSLPSQQIRLLDAGRRLSAASIWQRQTDFYESVGIDAWRGSVPSRITTSSYIARTYARCIAAYIADTGAQQVLIVEGGAGHGRFGYLCMQHLQELQQAGLLGDAQWQYVLTDIAERNIAFWQQHEGLAPLIQSGVADVARFAAGDAELSLRHSHRTITADNPSQHVVVIGNYFFDSLPIDVFRTEGDQLLECLPRITQTADSGEPDWEWEQRPVTDTAYADASLEHLVQHFSHHVSDGCFTIPTAGCRVLSDVRSWATDGMLLLAADKGYRHMEELHNRPLPTAIAHGGCYSFSVNFPAIAEWFQQQQGEAFVSAHDAPIVHVTAFAAAGHCPLQNLRREYHHGVNDFNPGEFHQLSRRWQDDGEIALSRCLSLLRLSGHDALVFYQLRRHIRRALSTADSAQKRALTAALPLIERRYFHWGTDDIPFAIGHLWEKLGHTADAVRLYELSLRLFGDHPTTLCNLARCHVQLDRPDAAVEFAARALQLKPDSSAAAGLLQQLECGNESAAM